jgi:hypothetical protein
MPDLSANRATMRQDRHSIDLYFTPLFGEQIWTGTVASTPAFPAKAISITGGSGTIADVKRGMRVTIETSGGLLKGETHIRAAGTISATVLPIRETSRGDIAIVTGDVVRVYNAIYLQDKLVSADASFSPDNLAYSAQNSTVPPIAISGGHFVGFVDSGQVYKTVVFAGSESYTVDADSGGTVTHSWVFPTATGTTTSSSANPTFTLPVGYHIGSHTVTDSSNSAPWTQFIMGHVYDRTNPPAECVITALDGSVENGWSASVQVFGDATLDDIPDKCMGIVWSEETYAGTVQSFGNVIPSRSHIKAIGYLSRDTNHFDPVNSTLVFDLISPLARLQALPGYSKVMLNTASPDKWREIEDLSVKRAIIVLLRYYTNLTEVFDFLYDADEYAFPRFYLQKNTPAAQTIELADGVDARFVANRTGRFMVQKRQELTILADRSALTTTLALELDDIMDYDFPRDHYRTVELIEARGFIADQTDPTPIFARWPGLGPGQGTQSSISERLIAASQADLNRRAGLRGAALDGVFISANDKFHKTFDLRLILRGAYDVFDFYKEWVEVDIAGTTNLRGIDLSEYRYTFQGANISYDHSTASAVTELTLRAETAAPAGVKYSPTTPPNSNTPDYTPPDLDIGFTPVPDATVLIPGYDPDAPVLPLRIFATNGDDAQAAISDSYDSGTGIISWTEISTGLTGDVKWASGDPYSPDRMFVVTDDGLFKAESIWAFDTWSLIASNTDMFGASNRVAHKILMSINRRGYIAVMSHSMINVSFDYGVSWEGVTDPASKNTYGTSTLTNSSGDIAISPRNNPGSSTGGHIYASVYAGILFGNQFTNSYYISTDWGLTWTFIINRHVTAGGGGTIPPGGKMHVPFVNFYGQPNSNGSSQEVWLVEGKQNGGLVTRSNGRIATANTQMLFTTTTPYPVSTGQSPLNAFTWGSYNWYVGAGGGTVHGFHTGVGATTTSHSLSTPTSQAISVNGWPLDPNVAIIFATLTTGATPTNTLSLTLDGGSTFFGQRPAFFTGQNTSYAELNLIDVLPPS